MKNKALQELHTFGTNTDETELSQFAEIDLETASSVRDAVSIPPPEAVSPAKDEKRARFYAMRQIASDLSSFHTDISKVFYHQALYMKDVEDDYEEQVPFLSYYPYYQLMGHRQLRTYFTWRTQVRNEDITGTSVSYAFLYIYELLNNIGVTGPEEGLDKLVSFWQTYRDIDSVIDRYIYPWIKDYHVYYPLPRSFREFVDSHNLRMQYPSVFVYTSGREDSFDLYAAISKYNIKKSVFYGEETRPIINDCFFFILDCLRETCRKKKKCFEDFIFYPVIKESAWHPFSRALFYPAYRQPDRQVIVSEKEMYTCHNNRWTYKTVILTERGKLLISYIMKEMESSLRRAVKFRHKLSASPNMCDEGTLKKLRGIGVIFPQFIQECVSEFYRQSTRIEIKVDTGNLEQIRKEALDTQEKLIVPEELFTDDIEVEDEEPVTLSPISDVWTGFREILTPIETDALKIILAEQDVKGFADRNRIMLEVLADGINRKAMDCLGDTVLELDDTLILYEEYRAKLMEMVGC